MVTLQCSPPLCRRHHTALIEARLGCEKTVFSHTSKLDLADAAVEAVYDLVLHVVIGRRTASVEDRYVLACAVTAERTGQHVWLLKRRFDRWQPSQ